MAITEAAKSIFDELYWLNYVSYPEHIYSFEIEI